MRIAATAVFGLVCVVFGILLSSNVNLPPQTIAQPAPAQTNATFAGYPVLKNNSGDYESPFVSVVEKYANAVVNISARTREPEGPWWFHGGGGGYGTSLGSGFFFREDGYILTNNHVVKDAVELTVRTSSGYDYKARLVGSDPESDLAVIKVDPEEKVTIIPFGDSEGLKVGDWAIAIGNPFPQQGLDRTVTVGVISAKGRSNLRFGENSPIYQNYIQTDASINPGNSGGPLLNIRGECVGVNAAISSPTGSSVGIGFAIPINLARAIVPDLIQSGKASRGWMGVWLNSVTEREAKRQGLNAVKGVLIDSVFEGSPAAKAGIRSGDIIVRFNNQDILNPNQFSVAVSTLRHDQSVPAEIVRNGKHITVTTTVADRDAFLAKAGGGQGAEPGNPDGVTWMGMDVVPLTDEIANEIGVNRVDGVYVIRVYPGSPADRAEIYKGTIIRNVNNQPVKSMKDFRNIVHGLRGATGRVPLIVQDPDGTVGLKAIRL
ncbi:MAG: trypsin-like peptidase domain-containing protein [candidate division Zixibacteria bacterium]|nr:trypsin-like peptidase domain-containing protein [candidate division Zixibacteria bacterium]